MLSNYLAYRHGLEPDKLRDKTVIELGSGTGLVGLVVGLLEPSARIWITDQECVRVVPIPVALDLIRHTVLIMPTCNTFSPSIDHYYLS